MTVELKGLSKAIKDIEKRYGEKQASTRVTNALASAARSVAVPAIAASVDASTNGARNRSPWRRGVAVKKPGPMRNKVRVKRLRARPNKEYGAVYTYFLTSYAVAVIRGTKEHDIPNYLGQGNTVTHPGIKYGNDIIGRAMSKSTEAAMVADAARKIVRI